MMFLLKILNISLGLILMPLVVYPQSNQSQTQESDPRLKKEADWFTQVDLSIMGIDTKISYFNLYGDLGVNFFLNKAIYIGPNFSYKLASTTDNQVIEVDNIQADVNTFNEWGAGITIGGALFRQSRIIFSPEIQIDYFQYNLKDIAYSATNNLCISSSYIGWTPLIYFGAKISDKSSIGVKAGYRFPVYLIGSSNDVYNPQSYNVGLFFRFALSK